MRGSGLERADALSTQTAQVGDLKIDNDLLPTKASHPARAAGRYSHMSQFPT